MTHETSSDRALMALRGPEADPTAETPPAPTTRFAALAAAFASAASGFALAQGLSRAATSSAFIIWPAPGEIAGFAAIVLGLSLLGFALAEMGPRWAGPIGAAVDRWREGMWRRGGRDRTRDEFAQVEVGLLIAFSALAAIAAYVVVPLWLLVVPLAALGIALNVWAITTICRRLGFDPALSALVGLPYGMVAGWVLT